MKDFFDTKNNFQISNIFLQLLDPPEIFFVDVIQSSGERLTGCVENSKSEAWKKKKFQNFVLLNWFLIRKILRKRIAELIFKIKNI